LGPIQTEAVVISEDGREVCNPAISTSTRRKCRHCGGLVWLNFRGHRWWDDETREHRYTPAWVHDSTQLKVCGPTYAEPLPLPRRGAQDQPEPGNGAVKGAGG
jgi:hypothetical protein